MATAIRWGERLALILFALLVEFAIRAGAVLLSARNAAAPESLAPGWWQAFHGFNLLEFLVILFVLSMSYSFLLSRRDGSKRGHWLTANSTLGAGDRARFEALEQGAGRLDAIERRLDTLGGAIDELKRQNESLAEDYRFLQRLLEKNQ